MNKYFSNILSGVIGIVVTICLWSCAAENPFDNEGEGIVRLTTVVNSITTRADETTSDPLRDNCVVYISNENGLIYKEKGLDNVKESFTLKAGKYVAEAWTGDSVSASFDKKFYRGDSPFEVTKGSTNNVVINCRIANVVASINTESIDKKLIEDYKIKIYNSKGDLTFDKDNASYEKAYFMMPNGETSLRYNLTGTFTDGQTFDVTGTIDNVQRAHHYIINFECNTVDPTQPSTTGAVFVKIKIKDEEITDNKIETLNTRPTISSFRYDLDKQLIFVNDEDIPEKLDLQICGFKGIRYINLSSKSASDLGWPYTEVNLIDNDSKVQQLLDSGVEFSIGELNPETNVITATVSLQKSLIEKLSPNKTEEHIITIAVEDMDEPYEPTEVNLRIVRNEGAISYDDPIIFDKVNQNDGLLISSHSATLSFSLSDDIEGIPGVEYSKNDEDNWTFVPAFNSAYAPKRAPMKAPKKYTMTIKGLEAGTSYKYRAACGEFRSNDVMIFKTYSRFIIPNGDMEKWAQVSAGGQDGIKVPSRTGSLDFWGNGNPGAKMAGTILTDESTDMFHSPSKSARLESQFASVYGVGKFAAGNLFAGEYVKTDGTDGVLSFGQAFSDFSNGDQVDVRPSALRVFVNYRPKTGVNKKGANSAFIGEGKLDQAQIYVALTKSPISIETKQVKGDDGVKRPKKLFNPDDSEVLAYGQATLEGNYGSDGMLKELIIPIEYFNRSNGILPTHLVIVCSASKYGDYFSGGEGSTMYVDDFELLYE